MNATEIVAVLLEDVLLEEEGSFLLAFHGVHLPRTGYFAYGGKGKGAIREFIQRITGKDVQGEDAYHVLDDLIRKGYTVVLRNKAGGVVVYTDKKQVTVPDTTLGKLQKYFRIERDTPIMYTPVANSKGDYQQVAAGTVFPQLPAAKQEQGYLGGQPLTADEKSKLQVRQEPKVGQVTPPAQSASPTTRTRYSMHSLKGGGTAGIRPGSKLTL